MSLKLADFGFMAPLAGRDQSGLLTSHKGTPGYLSPEILERIPYDGAAVDIFTAGVVLFMITSMRAPFARADDYDNHYKWIA